MFGYVCASPQELKLKEYELYKAIYCGLCREMGKCTGSLSRLTLSYDFVFFAIIKMISKGEFPKSKKIRCIAHPTKKRICAYNSTVLKEAALLSSVLANEKLFDDISDSRCIKKMMFSSLRPMSNHMIKRARKSGLKNEISIKESIESLYSEEKNKHHSIDLYADKFGETLSKIFSYETNGDEKRILTEIGKYTGKYIYIADALDDIIEDEKKGSFNPILNLYGNDAFEEKNNKKYLRVEIAEGIKNAAMMNLKELSLAYELLDNKDSMLSALAENIIYIGMPEKLDSILKKITIGDNNE